MNSSIYLIQDREQYKQLVKILSRVFEVGFKVLGANDSSNDHTDSDDFAIFIKFPNFDRKVLISLGMSGTGYQTFGAGFFAAGIEYSGARDIPYGIHIKWLDDLVEKKLEYDTVYAGENNEEKQLDYFGKLKTELERLQKTDDERKWWNKHSFGF